MAEFAIMPIEDYSEACDKLRELDGSTGVIKSGDFSQKLQAIIDESAAQSIMLDQIEAALEGKAAGSGDAEMISVTVYAGTKTTQLLVFCATNLGEPGAFSVSGSGNVYQKVMVPKNSMIFVEKYRGQPGVQTAYRCSYMMVYPRNTSYAAIVAQVTEDGAQLTIN